jgi:hypothetical protein
VLRPGVATAAPRGGARSIRAIRKPFSKLAVGGQIMNILRPAGAAGVNIFTAGLSFRRLFFEFDEGL